MNASVKCKGSVNCTAEVAVEGGGECTYKAPFLRTPFFLLSSSTYKEMEFAGSCPEYIDSTRVISFDCGRES